MSYKVLNRRTFLTGTAGLGLAGALSAPALAQSMENSTEFVAPATGPTNNVSSFRMQNWQDYFENTRNGAILADLESRAVHFWSEDHTIYRLYPSSVPLNEELTRRGRTEVIKKVVNPVWIPTQDELSRNPDWPKRVEGGAPDNPLGIRALYLGWPAYRIHGTHDTRKIGRRSSSGCIGTFNQKIAELYELCPVGTRVKVL